MVHNHTFLFSTSDLTLLNCSSPEDVGRGLWKEKGLPPPVGGTAFLFFSSSFGGAAFDFTCGDAATNPVVPVVPAVPVLLAWLPGR